jgi:creatinine amidohydrolase
MTTAEFDEMDASNVIALLPVGAIEQHGPHLPVCVDAAINAGVLDVALRLLPSEIPLTVLPAFPYGKSVEHDDFAGTISLSASTLIAAWTDIGESVHRAGIEKLVLFNSHGGQVRSTHWSPYDPVRVVNAIP